MSGTGADVNHDSNMVGLISQECMQFPQNPRHSNGSYPQTKVEREAADDLKGMALGAE
jgi:hypothetical protein